MTNRHQYLIISLLISLLPGFVEVPFLKNKPLHLATIITDNRPYCVEYGFQSLHCLLSYLKCVLNTFISRKQTFVVLQGKWFLCSRQSTVKINCPICPYILKNTFLLNLLVTLLNITRFKVSIDPYVSVPSAPNTYWLYSDLQSVNNVMCNLFSFATQFVWF